LTRFLDLPILLMVYSAAKEFKMSVLARLCSDELKKLQHQASPKTAAVLGSFKQQMVAIFVQFLIAHLGKNPYDHQALPLLVSDFEERISQNADAISVKKDRSIASDIKGLYTNQRTRKNTADLHLFVEDSQEPILAHKIILVSRSSYFKKLLSAPETVTETVSGRQITTFRFSADASNKAAVVSQSVMEFLLKYIYLGKMDLDVTKRSRDEWMKLFRIAHLFEMKEVYAAISDVVAEPVSADNVFPMLNFAQIYGLDKRKAECFAYIVRHPPVLQKLTPKTTSVAILIELVQHLGGTLLQSKAQNYFNK